MFTTQASDYSDIMTVKEFVENVKCGAFIPDDGVGYWGNETHYGREFYCFELPPKEATHSHWFNN